MLEIPIWPGKFNSKLVRWMTYRQEEHAGTPLSPPGCPDCNARPRTMTSEIGQPLRILFACGHQFQSPAAGIKKREIPRD